MILLSITTGHGAWPGRAVLVFRGSILLLLLGIVGAPSGGSAGEVRELTRLVDSPTAGLVDKGRFGVDLRLFPGGGVLGQLDAGVMRRLAIGISYGGQGIIGDDTIDWYPRVETAVRYRIIEESTALPALTIGFETQGYGAYGEDRYQIKSKGLYLALSKNYLSSMGQFGVHGGFNLTREEKDDGDLSGWVGMDKAINEELSMVAEYDFAFNDNNSEALGSGRGYLNLGAYWSAVPNIRIGLQLKNMLGNGDEDRGRLGGPDGDMSREISVQYTEEF